MVASVGPSNIVVEFNNVKATLSDSQFWKKMARKAIENLAPVPFANIKFEGGDTSGGKLESPMPLHQREGSFWDPISTLPPTIKCLTC